MRYGIFSFIAILAAACGYCGAIKAGEAAGEVATLILKTAETDQGLCMVLDANDSALTAALAKGSRLYVQGCTWDAKSVAASRAGLLASGVAERAEIAWIESNFLPYADNLINVVVAPAWGNRAIEIQEVLRVLAPGGKAVLGNDGNPGAVSGLEEKLKQAGVKTVTALSRKGWITFVKPENPDFDTWTTNYGNADLSYSSNDKAAGPWEELRWIGDPRWGALAGTYSGRVTAGGRIYYVETRSSAAVAGKPAAQAWWVARDAYNGCELWRAPLEGKGFVPLWGPGNSLTCDEKWTYASHQGTLIARDGKSGEIVKEYKSAVTPRNVTSAGGFLLVCDVARDIAPSGSALAFEKASAKTVWTRPAFAPPPAADGVAFVLGATELEGVEIATGASKWRTTVPKADGKARVFCKSGIVYVVQQPNWKPVSQIVAFNAKTGALLWADTSTGAKANPPMAVGSDLCFTVNGGGKDQHVLVMDGLTGKISKEIPVKGLNGKCYGVTGASQYMLYGNCSYLDVQTGTELTQNTVRSPCFLGAMSANGLTYFLPHHCDCGITLRGFLAMSRAGSRKWFNENAKDGSPQLYPSGTAAAPAAETPDDWPIYRKDTQRSNSISGKLPEQLKLLWTEKVGTSHLTQAVSAYGVICTAEPQTHRVFGRDAASGKELWSFVADGRVEFPPALHKGLCLFGTGGGSVYALDAKSGKEIWRLRAAPAEKFIAEEGQFASAWPIVGGVMPMNGEIFFTCGRSAAVDGGIFMFAVDAATGKTRWRVRGGSSGDFFLSDGKDLYLTKLAYQVSNGGLIGGGKASASVGLLRTTAYLTYVSAADYMACVEPSLSSEKHVELTDGVTSGENLAFNSKGGVAAWRNRFGVPPDLMKKEHGLQRFVYARGADGKLKWRLDDGVKQQMLGVVLAGETAYMAGIPASLDPKEKSELWVLSMADGKNLQTITLEGKPVYDGLSAAGGRLYLSNEDGSLSCFGAK